MSFTAEPQSTQRKRTKTLCSLCLCGGLFLLFFPQTLRASPIIDAIVNQISQTDYKFYVQNLEDFGTRYYNTAGNTAAAEYIYDEFDSFGLSVAYDPFTYSSQTYNNVVATLPGSTNPDDIYIVGAHFDSISNDSQNLAPGADDNASGVAAVLEMASVLSNYAFDSTILFIGFNVEEKGLIGSEAYADEAEIRGDSILGMLNFDMIAYTADNPDEDLDVFGEPWLVDAMIGNAAQYTSLATEAHYEKVWGSDHYYFDSNEYPGSSSILSIENTPNEIWGGSNPFYHETTDTSDHLDFDFALDITRAGVATVAELAQNTPIPAPGTIWLLGSGLVGIVIVRRKFKK